MRPGVGPLPLLSFKFRAYWEFSRRLHPLLHANPRRFAREVHTYNTLGFASSLFKQYTTIFFLFSNSSFPLAGPQSRESRDSSFAFSCHQKITTRIFLISFYPEPPFEQ